MLLKTEVIKKTKFENLDLVSSNVDLSGLEVETADDANRAFILKLKLAAYLNSSRGSPFSNSELISSIFRINSDIFSSCVFIPF